MEDLYSNTPLKIQGYSSKRRRVGLDPPSGRQSGKFPSLFSQFALVFSSCRSPTGKTFSRVSFFY